MEIFHASGLWYEVGDVIQPGNWGRVVLGAGPNAHIHFFRELLFEEMREQLAPDQPSRLRAFFGVRTVDDLRRYQQVAGATYGYRVAIPDSAAIYLADLEVFDRLQGARDPGSAKAAVAEYWSGNHAAFMELLVEAPAEVLDRL